MLWGQAWSVGWGDPEDFFQAVPPHDLFTAIPGGVVARFVDPNGFAGYTRIVADGVAQGIKKATVGDLVEMTATWERTGTAHIVSLVPQGGWAAPIFDARGQQNAWMAERPDRFSGTITAQPSVTMYSESGGTNPFSALTLHRLKRFKNVSTVTGRPTIGLLKMEVKSFEEVDSDGLLYRYVGVYDQADTLIAFGRSVCAVGHSVTITLIPYWGYDVWGEVTFTYTEDVNDIVVLVRWPSDYSLFYQDETVRAIAQVGVTSGVLRVVTSTAHHLSVNDSVALVVDAPHADLSGNYVVVTVTSATEFRVATGHANITFGVQTGTVAPFIDPAVTTPRAQIKDDGTSNLFYYTSPVLPVGAYHVDAIQLDECGNKSAGSIDKTLAIVAVFAPPTDLRFAGTDSLNSTVLFTPSASGVPSAYNLYDSLDTGELQLHTTSAPAAVYGAATTTLSAAINASVTAIPLTAWPSDWPIAAAGSFYIKIGSEIILVTEGHSSTSLTVLRGQLGTTAASHIIGSTVTCYSIYWLLPAMPSSYTGTRFSLVRALNAGVEEGNLNIVQAEYRAVSDGGTSSTTTTFIFITSTKPFTVTGSAVTYRVGMRVRASVYGDPASYMEGYVTSVVGSVVTITVDAHAGSGSYSSWVLTLIDYAVVVPARPPAPHAAATRIRTSGLELTVPVTIDVRSGARGTATELQLFLVAPGGDPDYTTPDATVSLVQPTGSNPLILTEIAATAGVQGVWFYALRTATADGTQSANVDVYGPVPLIDADDGPPNDPILDIVGAK